MSDRHPFSVSAGSFISDDDLTVEVVADRDPDRASVVFSWPTGQLWLRGQRSKLRWLIGDALIGLTRIEEEADD
jgi:hypothetical protein